MNDFLKLYREEKKIRDLIKRSVFTTKILNNIITYDNHDLQFKITHIKECDTWSQSVVVNIKVCGRLRSWSWNSDEYRTSNITIKRSFRSSVERNRRIRIYAGKKVSNYLMLFGVRRYNVEIGKVAIVDSL